MKIYQSKNLNSIKSSQEDDTRVADKSSQLKDLFEYVIAGLEQLDSPESVGRALEIADQLISTLDDVKSEIASEII